MTTTQANNEAPAQSRAEGANSMDGLDEHFAAEVKNVMDLALDWLMAWDVVGGGVEIESPEKRIAAMHKLKDAVTELALKAQSTVKANANLTSGASAELPTEK